MIQVPASLLSVVSVALSLALPRVCAGQADTVQSQLSSMKGNVVRVIAENASGFGFVVGIDDRKLLIATAEHTVATDSEPQICILDQSEPCTTGAVIYVDDPVPGEPDLDLAVVELEFPAWITWRPDLQAPEPVAGDSVWFIGRDIDWYIPPTPGRVVAPADNEHVSYLGLPVASGVSGAPIVSRHGIVAMHVRSDGANGAAHGIALREIKRRVEGRLAKRWVLVPQADCSQHASQVPVLSGRAFTVHFDWARPSAGLGAIALLQCFGTWAQPQPVWRSEEWLHEGIVYASGDLRTARALQTILTSVGRLDTELGEPRGDGELWIR